jgi:hypothetical protein
MAIGFDTFEHNLIELDAQGSVPDPKDLSGAVERLVRKTR